MKKSSDGSKEHRRGVMVEGAAEAICIFVPSLRPLKAAMQNPRVRYHVEQMARDLTRKLADKLRR